MTPNDKRAQQRENPEPEEGTGVTPKPVILWICILIVWGVGYYAWQIGKPMLGGDSRSPVAVTTQSPENTKDTEAVKSSAEGAVAASGAEATEAVESTDNADSAESAEGTESTGDAQVADASDSASVDGKTVFSANCSACHQASGQGIPGAFPPLSGSKWADAEDPNLPLAIVHDGLSGEISVAGNTFNGAMPAFKGTLSSAEIAAVLTYVRQEWDNNADGIDVSVVEEHNTKFGDRGPWTVDELKQTFQTP